MALQEKCLELEQKLAATEEEKKNVQEQLDSLNDTLQEKETELNDLQLQIQQLTLEVQNTTKENGELSMQFADLKMAADRIRYESTEQALMIDTLTSENTVMRSELQLLQDQVKSFEEEKEGEAGENVDDEPPTPTEAHAEKSSPVKRYSTEWAQKEEQLKRELEEGFLSSSTEIEKPVDAVEQPARTNEEVQARITELEEAIKHKDATFEEEQRKHKSTHGVLTSQHSQLQLEHVDLQSQLHARDAEIAQLRAKLEEQAKQSHQREQKDQQEHYRRAQDAKWQQQKQEPPSEPTEATDRSTEERPTEEEPTEEEPTEVEPTEVEPEEQQPLIEKPVDLEAPEEETEQPSKALLKEHEEAHARVVAEFEQQLSSQAAEIAKLIQENNALKTQSTTPAGSDSQPSVDGEKFKELETANRELRGQFDALEQATKANEEASKAKLDSEIKRLQNQTSVKLAEFASMRDALLLDLENRCQKVVDLEMLLDDAQDKYHTLLAQMKKAGGKQQHYELLQQKLDLATSAKHQLSIDNNKLKLDLQVATKQLALRDGHIASLESLLKDTQERFHKLAKGYETVADELAKFKEGSSSSGSGGSVGSLFGRTRTSSTGIPDHARVARPLRGGGGHLNPSSSITAAISSASPPPRSNNSSGTNPPSLTALPPMPSPFNLSNNYTTSSSSPLGRPRPTDSPATPGSANNTPYGQNSIWDIFRGAKKGSPKPGTPSSYPATPSTPSTLPSSSVATPASPFSVSLASAPQTPASPPPAANTNSYAPAVPTSPFVPTSPPLSHPSTPATDRT